jgi:MFS family permease
MVYRRHAVATFIYWASLLLLICPCDGFAPRNCRATTKSHVGLEQRQRKQPRERCRWVNRYINTVHWIQTHTCKVRLSDTSTPSSEKEAIASSTTHEDIDEVKGPLALLLLSQFVLFVGVGAIVPAIPLYGQSIGLSQASNGIVISAPAVALLLGAKYGGNVADVARKPAMMWGMAAIALFDIGTALSSTLPMLILARLGLGAGRCLAESGERGMLADLAGRVPSLRGRALAAQQAVIALGIAIGAPLGGIVIEEYGPRASFLCVSAGALVALLLYCFLPETVVPQSQSSAGSFNTSTLPLVSNADGEWTALLSDRRWKGLAICQSGASFGFAAKVACIPLLATATLPAGAVGTGALLSVAGLSGLIGAPVGGWLTDRVGARVTATVSGLLSATGLVLIPAVLNPAILDLSSWHVVIPFLGGDLDSQSAAFVFVVLLWSFGAAAQGPALTAVAQQLAPAGAEATALALPRAAGDGTYVVAPLLLGTIADATLARGGSGWECAVAGCAGLFGALALALTSQPKQHIKTKEANKRSRR